MKVFRVIFIVLALQALARAEAGAVENPCRAALDRCLAQCAKYPSIARGGCMLGCGIGYLNCDGPAASGG